MLNSKNCPKCTSIKNFEDFAKNRSTKDGLQTYCKSCAKIVTKLYKPSDRARKLKNKRQAAWKLANKILTRDYDRELLNQWRKANPLKASAHSLNRRASKLNATPPWLTKQDKEEILLLCSLRNQLDLQTGLVHHLDHIVPLQGENVCGLHVPWNLQILTAEDNCSKGNKLLENLSVDLTAPFYTFTTPAFTPFEGIVKSDNVPDTNNEIVLDKFKNCDTI